MITRADVSNTKDVYDLLCATMGRSFDYEAFQVAYAEYIKDDRIAAFIALEEERVIGFMNVRVDFQLHHMANVAEIMELGVVYDAHSKETEKQLVKEAVRYAKEHHCDCIEVCTRRTNERAHRFYEREGFNKSHYKLKMPLHY